MSTAFERCGKLWMALQSTTSIYSLYLWTDFIPDPPLDVIHSTEHVAKRARVELLVSSAFDIVYRYRVSLVFYESKVLA